MYIINISIYNKERTNYAYDKSPLYETLIYQITPYKVAFSYMATLNNLLSFLSDNLYYLLCVYTILQYVAIKSMSSVHCLWHILVLTYLINNISTLNQLWDIFVIVFPNCVVLVHSFNNFACSNSIWICLMFQYQ